MSILDKIKFGLGGNENDESNQVINPYDDERMTRGDRMEMDAADPLELGMPGTALQLKVVKPTSYSEAKQIASYLIEGMTVVLNLEGTQKEDAIHLIDFLHGVVYSIQGNFKNVAANTFIITPHNVDVTSENVAAAAIENDIEE